MAKVFNLQFILKLFGKHINSTPRDRIKHVQGMRKPVSHTYICTHLRVNKKANERMNVLFFLI